MPDKKPWENSGLRTFRDVDDLLEYYGERLHPEELEKLQAFLLKNLGGEEAPRKRQLRR